jgi:hypothetical protein
MRELLALTLSSFGGAALLLAGASCGRLYEEDLSDASASSPLRRDSGAAILDAYESGVVNDSGGKRDGDVNGNTADAADAGWFKEGPSIISPYYAANTLTYQRAIDWTIAAFTSDTTIFYTLDGTPPSLSSLSANGVVTFPALPDGTNIQWITGPNDSVHSFDVKVDPALKDVGQGLVHRFMFAGTGSPVVKVNPGATISGKTSFVLWNGNGTGQCPNCIIQIMVGIGVPQACLYSGDPYIYPGITAENVPFTFKAPTTPGTYEVKTGYNMQYNCTDALTGPLGDVVVGTVIVE